MMCAAIRTDAPQALLLSRVTLSSLHKRSGLTYKHDLLLIRSAAGTLDIMNMRIQH